MDKSKNIFLLLLLALCWGPSFFFIKIILEELPTFTLVCARLSLASLVLILIIKAQGKSLLSWIHYWKQFVIVGFFANALPFVLITYAETQIASSLAGIINSSPPIFTAILAHFFLHEEKMSAKKISGILIGTSGIVAVFLPSLLKGVQANFMGVAYVTIASISYAIAMVYSRKHLMKLPNLIGPTYQLIMAALLTLPFAVVIDRPYLLAFPSLKVISSLFGLVLLGTVFAFVIYYAILKNVGATYLSTSTLLFPFVSIFLGVIFLKEELHWNAYLGCLLILTGLVITNSLINFKEFISLFKVKRWPWS